MERAGRGAGVPPTWRHGSAGFSMVEVAVAIGVLLIAVLTAFGSQLTSFRLMNSSREDNTAVSDLAACMEEMLIRPAGELPVEGSDYEHGEPVARYEGAHLRDQRIVATYPGYAVGGPIPDPLQIVLTLTWTGNRGDSRRLELRSMKAQ